MLLKKIEELQDENQLLEGRPIFVKNGFSYFRKEKCDYYSFYCKNSFVNEMIMNEMSFNILKLCDGQAKVASIISNLVNQYQEVDECAIKKDVFIVLLNFSRIGLITWGKEENPFMLTYEKELGNRNKLSLVKEGEIRDVLAFLNEIDFSNISSDFFFYINPEKSVNEYKNKIALRYKLFSYLEDFFLIRDQKNKIVGIISIVAPLNDLHNVGYIGLAYLHTKELKEVLSYIYSVLPEISIRDINKISIFIPITQDQRQNISDIENIGFKLEANLQKEINGLDLAVLSNIIR